MQVAGKKRDRGLINSSDQMPTPYCQSCDGRQKPAVGYCQTCRDYLCDTCYNIHTKPKPMRHHVLLDKSKMPVPTSSRRGPRPSLCTLPCPDHTSKLIECFCPTHDTVSCSVCTSLNHRSCHVDYIPDLDIVMSYKNSAEYKQLRADLDAIREDNKILAGDVKETRKAKLARIKKAIDAFQHFKKDFIAELDKAEQDLMTLGKKYETEENKASRELTDDIATLDDEVDKATKQLTSLQNEPSNHYAAAKLVRGKVSHYKKMLVDYAARNTLPDYLFRKNDILESFLSSKRSLGTLERSYQSRSLSLKALQGPKSLVNVKSAVVSKQPDINTNAQNNEFNAMITGLVLLSPRTLLATDHNNNSLKSIDVTTNTITDALTLPDRPWDITLLPDDQAAVTLCDINKIQFISTKGKPSCSRSISVYGECLGIASIDTHLAVTFIYPNKVEIMDLKGKVITRIVQDDIGQPLFEYPRYITVSQEKSGNMIYVSDYCRNTITITTEKGKVVGQHKHNSWNRLVGLIIVDGDLLVCNAGEGTVDVVSNDGVNIVALVDTKHGIDRPRALCYCESEATLCQQWERWSTHISV